MPKLTPTRTKFVRKKTPSCTTHFPLGPVALHVGILSSLCTASHELCRQRRHTRWFTLDVQKLALQFGIVSAASTPLSVPRAGGFTESGGFKGDCDSHTTPCPLAFSSSLHCADDDGDNPVSSRFLCEPFGKRKRMSRPTALHPLTCAGHVSAKYVRLPSNPYARVVGQDFD